MKHLIPLAFQVSSRVAPELSAKIATELFLRPKRYPQSQKEIEILSTATTEILRSGRRVYFWGEGPVVTFVHGWESRGSAFHKWIPLFVNSGYKVMTWDGPAHGQSPGKRTHAPEIAKSLEADIKELGISIYGLVGHSLGGVVVGILSKLMKVPAKIIILSAPALVTSVFERYHDQIRLSPTAREIFHERIKKETGISAKDANLADNDLSLKTDTLLIHDVLDREVPFSDFEILHNTWKKARFLATSGLGHRRILRDESVAHQIIGFLKESK